MSIDFLHKRIEILEAANERLRAALQEYLRDFGDNEDSDSQQMAAKARAALAPAPPPAAMSEWQPIETAPKDGTEILLSTNGDGIHIGQWAAHHNCFVDTRGAPFGYAGDLHEAPWIPASYWQPLPDEPEYDN